MPKKTIFSAILALQLFAPMDGWRTRAEVPELPATDPNSQPSLERFRDWPPEELLERPYWSPWAVGTFVRASLFGRPVLFVMAPRWNRSSRAMMDGVLQDPRVLRAMNEMYVPVLVNPDRRPDLRERYQTGAWPVIALLLPTGNPMLSRANEARSQQPITIGAVDVDAMLFLLEEGQKYYQKWSRPLTQTGEGWREREAPEPPPPGIVTQKSSDEFAEWLLANADRQQGGFGLAPKFPVPGLYAYGALRAARGKTELLAHASFTLQRIVDSPLYDRREGGIHRLAREGDWSGIEYEKMLEPNAQLLRELVLAARQEETPAIREAIRGTAAFLRTVLAREQGGFSVGQWADPASEDGGGYWRGENEQAPPVEPLVLSGSTATAGEALLLAGVWLDDGPTRDAGVAALRFVAREGYRPGRGFDHVLWPSPSELRLLASQADVALALLGAYQVTGDGTLLRAARGAVDFALDNLRLGGSEMLVDHLPDPAAIGLLRNPRFPLMPNVRLARAMLRLARLTDDERYFEGALAILGSVAAQLRSFRPWPAEAGLAIEEALSSPLEIRIEGPPGSPEVAELGRAAARLAWPWTIVSFREGPAVGASLEWNGRHARALTVDVLAERVRELTTSDGKENR